MSDGAPIADDAADRLFREVFGRAPAAWGEGHARANLLGEHTDYNDGFVLPTPLAYRTLVAAAPAEGRAPGTVRAHAAGFDETLERHVEQPAQGDWLDYVAGSVWALKDAGHAIPALEIAIASDVPMGAGLSSSAALELAVLRAVRAAAGLAVDEARLAVIGRTAENAYVGMPCGIMDQMVAALGSPGQALFLDTRDLSTRLVGLPADHAVAVIHCGVAHRLTAGAYATRKAECERACDALGVTALRDLSPGDLDRIMALPEPLGRRARHVVTENARVLDGVKALEAGDAPAFGRLMDLSHDSQRDDYEVSIPEIDALVDSARRHGATGARLTGGGFGGSIVALVERGRHDGWLAAVLAENPQARAL